MSVITCYYKHKTQLQIVKIILNNSTTHVEWCLSRSQQRKHLIKCLSFYYQGKGYLEDVVQDCNSLFLYRSEVYVELRRHIEE